MMDGVRRHLRRRVGALTFAVVALGAVAAAGPARAQDREADAERLFREGQKLLEERRFGEACPKFEAAYKKDGQLGTLINLAFCHKEQGAIWYAWLEFRAAEVKAAELGRSDRKEFAKKSLVDLEKQLLRAVVDNPRGLPLSEVLVEDRVVPEAERGVPFAVEGGKRKITFRAKGKRPAVVLVNVTRSDRPQRLEVPEMEDLTAEDLPPEETPERATRVEIVTREDPGSTQRTLGWVTLGALGGGGLAVMSIAGTMAVLHPCASAGPCTFEDRSAASDVSAVATVGGVVAAVGILGGLALLLTAPSTESSEPSNAPSTDAESGEGGREEAKRPRRRPLEVGFGPVGVGFRF